MFWILFARVISVMSVLLQLRIFARLFDANETSRLYFILAVLGGFSLVSCALPNYLAVQSAYDSFLNRKKIYRKIAIFLFLGGLLSIVINELIISNLNCGIGRADYFGIGLLIFFSNFPTVVANHFFAQKFLKQGAMLMALNVILSQIIAIFFVWCKPAATFWLFGLCIGHFIAAIISFYFLSFYQKEILDAKAVSTPEISKKVLFSVLFAILFGWLVPNLPRLLLQDSSDKSQLASVLLFGALTYSGVNTLELLITQIRRSVWLEINIANMQDANLQFKKKILKERIYILFFYIVSAFLFFLMKEIIFQIITGEKLILPNLLVFCVIVYEFTRSAISSFYALDESARIQFSTSLVLCFGSLFIATGFYFGKLTGIEEAYFPSNLLLLIMLAICFFSKQINFKK